ncbi:MAG: methyltransferase [Planctomycetes bacterium]|nr:methyltransferase [Planctomycetota bacterium]
MTAPFRVRPFRDLLVVSDHFRQVLGPKAAEHVLTVNPAAILMLDSTIRRPFASVLDLGCGNGIQALVAAAHCVSVTATDINPRCLFFTRLSAELNGLGNIECLEGDLFAPVSGRTPPFILGPSEGLVYAHSEDEPLDGFCRRLVRGAPEVLAEGGFLQMICEWAEVEGEPWTRRLEGWFGGLGCDVWVMPLYSQTPESYTQSKLLDAPWRSEDDDAGFFEQWMAFFRAHRVTAMHGGLIALRRRTGRTWAKFMTHADRPRGAFGDAVHRGFANRDVLEACPADADLLTRRFAPPPSVRLIAAHRAQGGTWGLDSVRLVHPEGLFAEFPLRPDAADFCGRFDGVRPLSELAHALAFRAGVPVDAVVPEVCALTRELLERGYLLSADPA